MSTPRTLPRPTGRPRAGVRPVYEEFKPNSEWKEDEDSNILLLIHLPGFQTRDMKVSTEGRNIIRVRGERLVAGNKWSRFQEDFPVPSDCIMTGIRARFDGGILTITIPRKKKQVQEANPSTTTTIPSQTTTENLTTKPQPTPIGGHIRQPTPYKRVDDPTVLDDDKKLTKENHNTQDEKRPTLDPFRIGKPTPIKRADDEQRVLDEHEIETKDNQKLLDDKRLPHTLDPFHIRKPTPMKIRASEKSVLEDHEREAKDNEKLLEDKRSPTLDPFQIRKPTPMKIRASEKRVLEDREREAKDHEKLQDERRPTLDPFQIRKPTPMKRANDEKRVLEDHVRETRDYEKLLEEKRPTLDSFRIKKPTNIDEQSVHEDHERETKDHQILQEEHTPTLDPFQIKKPTQRFLDEQETRKPNKQKLPIAIKPIMEKKANYKIDKSKIVHKDKNDDVQKGASSSGNEDQIMGMNNYKKKVKSFLEVNEEKKLLVNMGVAVLVLVALGMQISHTIGSTREPSS